MLLMDDIMMHSINTLSKIDHCELNQNHFSLGMLALTPQRDFTNDRDKRICHDDR